MFRKSLVKRQFLQYITTILVCMILMGGMLSVVYTKHYMEDALQELIDQGE